MAIPPPDFRRSFSSDFVADLRVLAGAAAASLYQEGARHIRLRHVVATDPLQGERRVVVIEGWVTQPVPLPDPKEPLVL